MQKDIVIKVENITKTFGMTKALTDVSLQIAYGEIRGLIGENGSGKSTLASMIVGTGHPDSGRMWYKGEEHAPKNMLESKKKKINILVQENGTINGLTVAENMFLGKESSFSKMGNVYKKKLIKEAQKALKNIGADYINAADRIERLSFEDRKLVEVAVAMYSEPDVLFVDETTTALSQKGRELVYKLMDDMRKQGKTVIFISHDMEELERMCDSISVLRDGNFVGTIQKEEITQDVLKRMMIGRDLTGDYYRSDCKLSYSDRVVLEVNGVSYGTSVQNISFQLHKGEILGLGGLTECGMHELCKIIFGAVKPDKGSVRLADGTEIKSPSVAIENKIAYMPKDRDLESLFLATSIKDNISMASLNKVKKGIFIPPKEERELADFNAKKLEVKMQNITQYVRELSGGNKQKVVVAKWMANDSEILIMDCPTRGIDIGVKAAIYRLMEQLKKEGKSIIMGSEEMPELLGMSDRIIVMKDGKQTGQFERSESLGEENLIHAML